MSGRSAGSNMKKGVPAITDEATARSKLKGKEIEWFGEHPYFSGDPRFQSKNDEIGAKKSKQYGPDGQYDGWYLRNVSGHDTLKMLFGG